MKNFKFNFEKLTNKANSYNFIHDCARRCINTNRGWFVVAKDKFMSGWGCAEGRASLWAVYCFSSQTAETLKHNLECNKNFSRVRSLTVSRFLSGSFSGHLSVSDSIKCAAYLNDFCRENEKKERDNFLSDPEKMISYAISTLNFGRRPGWNHGVKNAAKDLVEGICDHYGNKYENFTLEKALNGQKDFKEFVYGGGAIISNYDICRAYCTDYQFNRYTDNGKKDPKDPNEKYIWMDIQAFGVSQGWDLLKKCVDAVGPSDKETYNNKD